MPVVYLDSNLPDASLRAVVGDNRGDARRAVEALAARGVKRFYYSGSTYEVPVLAERREGFQEAVASLKGPRAERGDLAWNGNEAEIAEKYRAHFSGAPRGSCTFFESLGALRRQLPALIASGRHFGDDLLLSGFDEPAIGDALGFFTQHPGLFTRPMPYVEQNASAMVEAALERLAQGPGQPGGVTRIPGILRHFS
jgi:DNA-binding LacI/PurR family transcriptional regulator